MYPLLVCIFVRVFVAMLFIRTDLLFSVDCVSRQRFSSFCNTVLYVLRFPRIERSVFFCGRRTNYLQRNQTHVPKETEIDSQLKNNAGRKKPPRKLSHTYYDVLIRAFVCFNMRLVLTDNKLDWKYAVIIIISILYFAFL